MKTLRLYMCLIASKLLRLFQEEYSKEWDDVLTKLINEGELVGKKFTTNFSKNVLCWVDVALDGKVYRVWTGNPMYSFGHNYNPVQTYLTVGKEKLPYVFKGEYRPSFKNMVELKLRVDELSEEIREMEWQ